MAIGEEIFADIQQQMAEELARREALAAVKVEQGTVLDPSVPRRNLTIPTNIGGGQFTEFEATQGQEEFLLGGEEFLGERGLGPEVTAPDTGFATAGRLAAPVAGALAIGAVPGLATGIPAILAQGGFAAGLEAIREGSSAEEIRNAALIAGGAQLGSNVLSRVLTGSASGRGLDRGRPVTFGEGIDDSLIGDIARGGRGAGSLRFADRLNQRLLYDDTARALGFTPRQAKQVKSIDRPFLQQARSNVTRSYQAAAPKTPVDVTDLKAALDKIPEGARSTKITELIDSLDGVTEVPASQWQPFNRLLGREETVLARNATHNIHAGSIRNAQSALADSAEIAGGNRALMTRANQQFKLLESLEEIPSVLNAERFTASQLNSKVSRDSFKGFGKRAVAEGSDTLNPEISALIDDSRAVSKFEVESAGGSQTAGREAAIRNPLTFAGLQLAGRASVGNLGLAPIGRAIGQAEATEGFGGPSLLDLVEDVPGVLDTGE